MTKILDYQILWKKLKKNGGYNLKGMANFIHILKIHPELISLNVNVLV